MSWHLLAVGANSEELRNQENGVAVWSVVTASARNQKAGAPDAMILKLQRKDAEIVLKPSAEGSNGRDINISRPLFFGEFCYFFSDRRIPFDPFNTLIFLKPSSLSFGVVDNIEI